MSVWQKRMGYREKKTFGPFRTGKFEIPTCHEALIRKENLRLLDEENIKAFLINEVVLENVLVSKYLMHFNNRQLVCSLDICISITYIQHIRYVQPIFITFDCATFWESSCRKWI